MLLYIYFFFIYETQGEPEANQVPDEGSSPEVDLKKTTTISAGLIVTTISAGLIIQSLWSRAPSANISCVKVLFNDVRLNAQRGGGGG